MQPLRRSCPRIPLLHSTTTSPSWSYINSATAFRASRDGRRVIAEQEDWVKWVLKMETRHSQNGNRSAVVQWQQRTMKERILYSEVCRKTMKSIERKYVESKIPIMSPGQLKEELYGCGSSYSIPVADHSLNSQRRYFCIGWPLIPMVQQQLGIYNDLGE